VLLGECQESPRRIVQAGQVIDLERLWIIFWSRWRSMEIKRKDSRQASRVQMYLCQEILHCPAATICIASVSFIRF